MKPSIPFTIRSLRRSPGPVAAAVIAIALGVGANTAIFSVLNATLLHPLPYPSAGRIVMVWDRNPKLQGFLARGIPASGRNFVEWRKGLRTFADLEALRQSLETLLGVGMPQQVTVGRVTTGLFGLFGQKAAAGRLFARDEGESGRNTVAVLSGAFAAKQFGGGGLGRTLQINGGAYTVVGVLPATFHLPGMWQGFDEIQPDVWLPMTGENLPGESEAHRTHYVFGRLRDGVSLAQARAELDAMAPRLAREYPKVDAGYGASVYPVAEEDASPSLNRTVEALQLTVAFVLLIACANVANLLLARGAGRARDYAIRAALGASRGRLMRDSMAESAAISAAGAALGVGLAWAAIRAIGVWAPEENRHLQRLALDGEALVVTAVVAVLSALLFGILPALGAARVNLRDALAQDGRAGSARGAQRLRSALVVSEVAFAAVLLAGAGLMVRSLTKLLEVDPGFRASHVLTMHIRLPNNRYAAGAPVKAFCEELLRRVSAIPGVRSAAISTSLPILDRVQLTPYTVEGQPQPQAADQQMVDFQLVSEDYFPASGTPLLRGRNFTRAEAETEPPRAVMVNDSLARELAKHGDPLAQSLIIGGVPKKVVGIVAGWKQLGLDAASRPELFLPSRNIDAIALLARTAGDPMALRTEVTGAVWAIDKDEPVTDIRSLEEHVGLTTAQRRFDAVLFAAFAALALALAALGLYSALTYAVSQRTKEIGVRMALGARPGDVTAMVLTQGLRLTLIGLAIGGAGAIGLTRLMSALVFGVSAADPLAFSAAAVTMVAVAAVASYVPAIRASRTDPVDSMK